MIINKLVFYSVITLLSVPTYPCSQGRIGGGGAWFAAKDNPKFVAPRTMIIKQLVGAQASSSSHYMVVFEWQHSQKCKYKKFIEITKNVRFLS